MDSNSEVVYLYLDDIIPNRFQPREIFDDQALKELAVSIKEHGVIQPIIVRKVENKYEIIAGERRYKASTMAGLTKIPAIIKNLDDKESSKVALIENLQRKDLSPIEEARTYQKILELEGSMTQEELAATMGKTQSSVSNKLRLLDLPEEIQDALLKEKISERHARSLLTISDKNDQIKMMDRVISDKMTVRELDKEIKILKGEITEPKEEEKPVEETTPESTPPVEEPVQITSAPIEISSLDETEPDNINNAVDEALKSVELPKPDLASFLSTPEDKKEENGAADNNSEGGSTFAKYASFNTDDSKADENLKDIKSMANMFSDLFDSNVNNNTSVASSTSTSEISTPATKDYNQAVTNVKKVITDLQTEGYKVTFDESNEDNSYKISIQIDKN